MYLPFCLFLIEITLVIDAFGAVREKLCIQVNEIIVRHARNKVNHYLVGIGLFVRNLSFIMNVVYGFCLASVTGD